MSKRKRGIFVFIKKRHSQISTLGGAIVHLAIRSVVFAWLLAVISGHSYALDEEYNVRVKLNGHFHLYGTGFTLKSEFPVLTDGQVAADDLVARQLIRQAIVEWKAAGVDPAKMFFQSLPERRENDQRIIIEVTTGVPSPGFMSFYQKLKQFLNARDASIADFRLTYWPADGSGRLDIKVSLPDKSQEVSLLAYTTLLDKGKPALFVSLGQLQENAALREYLNNRRASLSPASVVLSPQERDFKLILKHPGVEAGPTAAVSPEMIQKDVPLFAVIWGGFVIARQNGLFKNTPLTDDAKARIHNDISAFIDDGLKLERSSAYRLDLLQGKNNPNKMIFHHLDPIEQINVVITRIQYQGVNTPVAQLYEQWRKNGAGEVAKRSQEFMKKLEAELSTLAEDNVRLPAFLTRESVIDIKKAVAKHRRVVSVVTVIRGATLDIELTMRIIHGEFVVGGGYNSTDGLTGQVSLNARHLLLPNSLLMVKGQAGPDMQAAEFSYRIPLVEPTTEMPWDLVITPLGSANHNTRIKLGDPEGPDLIQTDFRTGVRVALSYDSTLPIFEPKPEDISYKINLALVPHYRWTNMEGPADILGQPPDGQAPYLALEIDQRWRLPANSGNKDTIGETWIDLDMDWQEAFDFFGSNLNYASYEIAPGARQYLGWETNEDIFLVWNWAAGIATSSTPRFAQFRLGGNQRLRGLQEGEYIGRSFIYQGFETGITIRPIVEYLFENLRNDQSATDAQNNSTTLGGVDLAKIYIKGLIESGQVSESSSLGEWITFPTALTSYGVALEYGGPIPGSGTDNGLVLSVGYAYSPQSSAREGRVFTSVLFSF